MYKYNEFINEQYNISIPSKELYNIIKELPYAKNIEVPHGEFLDIIELTVDEKFLDEFEKFVIKNKWYISRIHGNRIEISQKYVDDAKVNIPLKLYHATSSTNVNNILKHGLKTKSEDIRHKYPPRIYVTNKPQTAKLLSNELKRWKKGGEYTILEIDTNNLNIQLYKDSTCSYSGCYYIQDINKIPKENITIYDVK